NRVRDDLDGRGMRTCTSCHGPEAIRPARMGTTRPPPDPRDTHTKHLAGGLFHTYLVSCESCHAVRRPLRAMVVLDMSTGRESAYTVDGTGTLAAGAGYTDRATRAWAPWQTRTDRYLPVVPKHLQFFGERMKNGEIRPIPLHHVAAAARKLRPVTKKSTADKQGGTKVPYFSIVSEEETAAMLNALTKAGFTNVVLLADRIYELKGGKLSSAPRTRDTIYYGIAHGIGEIAAGTTYGRGGHPAGCARCHDEGAPFFTQMEITDIRAFFKTTYPLMKEPAAVPQYDLWGLKSVPSFE
ncbi:MAG: hypothetical protein N2Z74_07525, partial [Syntrophales bacterium]|nr:hypothetical protein [Syntrophales bacterium]